MLSRAKIILKCKLLFPYCGRKPKKTGRWSHFESLSDPDSQLYSVLKQRHCGNFELVDRNIKFGVSSKVTYKKDSEVK